MQDFLVSKSMSSLGDQTVVNFILEILKKAFNHKQYAFFSMTLLYWNRQFSRGPNVLSKTYTCRK
jgi:hypothetical protein